MTDERAWYLLAWFVVTGVCPALFLVLAVLGFVWRRRTPIWLPAVASVALLAYCAWPWRYSPDRDVFLVVVSTWCLIAVAFLVLAAIAIANRWRSRGALLVTGLALPLPMLALFFVYFLEEFASL